MSPSDKNKRFPLKNILNFSRIKFALQGFFKKILSIKRQKMTIMIIPHSEKKAVNFRVSFMSLVFFGCVFAGILVVAVVSVTKFSGVANLLDDTKADLSSFEEASDTYRIGTKTFINVLQEFNEQFNDTLELLDLEDEASREYDQLEGDLASFSGIDESAEGLSRDISELEKYKQKLQYSQAKLKQIVNNVSVYKDFLPLFPTFWPIKNNKGVVTFEFGPNLHPFTNQLYLHKGIDLAGVKRGTPIVASADGKVIEVIRSQKGYGNHVTIRHDYGFYTKYAHLDGIVVREGDSVSQGQQIGDIGNTGTSTGTHLHFEVRFGSQVIDPRRFIFVQKNME